MILSSIIGVSEVERYRDWFEQALRDLEVARVDLEHQYFEWACFVFPAGCREGP